MSQVANDIHFEILGPVRVSAGLADVAVGGRERVLLAMLLLRANEIVSMEALVGAVWDDQPPPTARNQVQGCVSRLRSRLGGSQSPIVTDLAGYGITVASERLDLAGSVGWWPKLGP